MYVLSPVDDTVWLQAHAFNRCAPEEGVAQKYWLVCSFYGLEEESASTSSATVNFEVVPNPNNGQMTLQFEQMIGKIDVKVYDMAGVLIDNILTYSDLEYSSMQYNLKAGCGVYYFVVTGKDGIMAKKVIVR